MNYFGVSLGLKTQYSADESSFSYFKASPLETGVPLIFEGNFMLRIPPLSMKACKRPLNPPMGWI